MRKAALCGVLLGLLLLGCGANTARRAHGQLEVSPRSVDWGSVPKDSPAPDSVVTLLNAGTTALTFSTVEVQGDLAKTFSLTPPQALTLAAGESLTLHLHLSTARTGVFGAALHLESDAENAPLLDVALGARVVDATPDSGADAGVPDGGAADDAGRPDSGSAGDAGFPDAGALGDAGQPFDAGGADAGSALDGGSTDAGRSDAGQPFDAGRSDAGLPPFDAGCVGTWRIAPSEGSTNIAQGGKVVPYVNEGLFLLHQRDWATTTLAGFEYRLDGGAHVPLNPPALTGDCDEALVGNSLVQHCWSGIARFDLSSRTWAVGAPPPVARPRAGSGSLNVPVGNSLFIWGYPGPGYLYDPALDTWAEVPDAGAPSNSARRGFTRGRDLVLYIEPGGPQNRLWVLSPDAGAWKTIDVRLADGGTPVYLVGDATVGNRLLLFGAHQTVPPSPWTTWELNLDDGGASELPTSGVAPTDIANLPMLFPVAGRVVALTPPTSSLISVGAPGVSHVLDLDSGVWAATGGELIASRVEPSVAASSDAVYVYGGASWWPSRDGGITRGLVYELRPPSNDWVPRDDAVLGMPTMTYGISGGVPVIASPSRNRAMVLGPPGGMFDPVSLAWEPFPAVPSPFQHDFMYSQRAVGAGDLVHILGYNQPNGGATLDGTGAWSLWSADSGFMPNTVFQPPVMLGNDVFTWGAGGHIYSPATDSWSTVATANAPTGNGQGVMLSPAGPDKVFVWGGFNTGLAHNVADGGLYDRSLNAWSPVSMVGASTAATGGATLWTGSEVLVLGGRAETGAANTKLQAYDPVLDVWRTLAPPPFSTNNGRIAFVEVPSGYLAFAHGSALGLYVRSANAWRCVNPAPSLGSLTPMRDFSLANVNGRVVVVGRPDSPGFAAAVLEGL